MWCVHRVSEVCCVVRSCGDLSVQCKLRLLANLKLSFKLAMYSRGCCVVCWCDEWSLLCGTFVMFLDKGTQCR